MLAQVVADVFGISKPTTSASLPSSIRARIAWSIASGNYSSRFAPAVAGAAHLAATKLRDRLARIAAAQLNVRPDDLRLRGRPRRVARSNPDASLAFSRVAATSHWSPGVVPDDVGQAIRETVFWTPPELTAPTEADEINSSLCHGFIFDFCGVEVDRVTGAVRIDRYVTMHDCGRVLHPGMVDGQVRGGFAQALGAALLRGIRLRRMTAASSPAPSPIICCRPRPRCRIPVILHIESAVAVHAARRQGRRRRAIACRTPVCIANAVADALGVRGIDLPLTPAKLAALVAGRRTAAAAGGAVPVKAAAGPATAP